MEILGSWDWLEVFKYTSDGDTNKIINYSGNGKGFKAEDVKEIIAMEEGENDDATWIGLFLLEDGRYAFVSAGCDYTGWGCQESGSSFVGATLDDMIQYGLGDDDRVRLFDQIEKYKNNIKSHKD